ncbi:hypothetical protein OROMI_004170 [Orobanche minor]
MIRAEEGRRCRWAPGVTRNPESSSAEILLWREILEEKGLPSNTPYVIKTDLDEYMNSSRDEQRCDYLWRQREKTRRQEQEEYDVESSSVPKHILFLSSSDDDDSNDENTNNSNKMKMKKKDMKKMKKKKDKMKKIAAAAQED